MLIHRDCWAEREVSRVLGAGTKCVLLCLVNSVYLVEGEIKTRAKQTCLLRAKGGRGSTGRGFLTVLADGKKRGATTDQIFMIVKVFLRSRRTKQKEEMSSQEALGGKSR